MKKHRKLLLLLPLLCCLMMLCTAPKSRAGDTWQAGDIIAFGSYPQRLVTDKDTLAQLEQAQKNWVSYAYYSQNPDSSSPQPSAIDDTMMAYAELTYAGVRYRAVRILYYRPAYTYEERGSADSWQLANGFEQGVTY